MKVTRKQVLGWAGLALVAAVTVFAYSIPIDASATTSQTDTVQVTVHEKNSVVVNQPVSGSYTISTAIHVETDFSDAAIVIHYLHYTNPETGEAGSAKIDTYIPSEDDPGAGTAMCVSGPSRICTGTRVFDFDLTSVDPDLSYGNYTVEAVIYDNYTEATASLQTTQLPDTPINIEPIAAVTASFQLSGEATTESSTATGNGDEAEDSSTFHYVPTIITENGTETNGDPVFHINSDSKVAYTEFQAYDQNGNPLFPSPIRGSNSGEIALPFDKYLATSQTYTISVLSYSADGTLLYKAYSIKIDYTAPATPVVPDTGNVLFGGLISRTDFLVSGLIVFGIVIVGSIALIMRNKKRHTR